MWKFLKKTIKYIIVVGAVMLCILFAHTSVNAEENLKIKVGFYDMHGFQEIDENGNYTGYNIEYLSIIAKRGQWNIEYVPIEDFTTGLEALESKEIDLLAPCKLSSERLEKFVYSSYSFGTDYYVLVTGADNDEAHYEDFEYISSMKIAVVKDYPLTDDFIQYTKENNISPEFVYYDNADETLEAMRNGEVDGAATSLMVVDEEFKVLAKYASAPFYFMSWKGNEDKMYVIDEMMHYISTIYPQIVKDLEDKYYPIYSEQHFTKAELDFLAKQDTLRVAYMDDYSPISLTNYKGELSGVSRIIFDEIQEITGLKFEYIKLPKGAITYDFLIENKIDLVTGVTYNGENVNSKRMVLSIPYVWSSKIFVGKDITRFDKDNTCKVAVIKGSQTIEKVILNEYPNFSVTYYDTLKECFDKVNSGEVDFVFTNQFVANNMLIRPQYYNLQVVPIEGLGDELCFASIVTSEGDSVYTDEERMMLIRIIDKAISIMGKDKLNEYMVAETMNQKYEYSFGDYIYKYRYLITAGVFLLMLLGVIFFYLIKHKINQRKRNIKEAKSRIILQRRYEAILHNSDVIIYELDLKEEKIIISDKFKEKFGKSVPEKVENLTPEITADLFGIYPDDRPKMLDTYYFDKDCSEGDNEVLVRVANKSAEYIWCEVTRVPIFNSDDEIVSVVGKIVDVDEEIKEKLMLEEKARKDGLSGLLNKTTFEEEINEYLGEHSSYFSAMIFVDMDHFKDINDYFGHDIGDRAIKDVSEKLGLIFSHIDLISRFGGDEFCVFVKNIPEHTLKDKIEWALNKLKATYESEKGEVHITASIGVAYCKCNDATYEAMFKTADEAVYNVKENGRNGYLIKEIL